MAALQIIFSAVIVGISTVARIPKKKLKKLTKKVLTKVLHGDILDTS